MDPSMIWHFHKIEKTLYKVVGNTMVWNVLEIIEIDNIFTIKHFKLKDFQDVFLNPIYNLN